MFTKPVSRKRKHSFTKFGSNPIKKVATDYSTHPYLIEDILGLNIPTDVYRHLIPFFSTQDLTHIQCLKRSNKKISNYSFTIASLCPTPPYTGDLFLHEGSKLYLKTETTYNTDPSQRPEVDALTIQCYHDRIRYIIGTTGKPGMVYPIDVSILPNLIHVTVKELSVFRYTHVKSKLILPPSVQVLIVNKLKSYSDELKHCTKHNCHQLKFLHVDRSPKDFLVYDALIHYPNLRVLRLGFLQSNPKRPDILTENDLDSDQEYVTIARIEDAIAQIEDNPIASRDHVMVPNGLQINNDGIVMTSRSLDVLIIHGNYFCEANYEFVKSHTQARVVIINRYEFWHPEQVSLLFSPWTYPGKEKIQLWVLYDNLPYCISSIFQAHTDTNYSDTNYSPTLKHIHIQVAIKNENAQLPIAVIVPHLLETIKTGLASKSNCIDTFVIMFHRNEENSYVYAHTVFHNTSIWICDADNQNAPVIDEVKEIKDAISRS